MGGQECDTPHCRPIAQLPRIGLEVLENVGGRQLRRHHRAAAPRGINQGGDLVTRQIAMEPVINGLLTYARQCRPLADGFSFGDPEDSLNTLKETRLGYALERVGQARDIVVIESSFGWTFPASHVVIVNCHCFYFKKLLLTHLDAAGTSR